MKTFRMYPIGQLLVALSLAVNAFAFGGGNIRQAGASSNSSDPKTEAAASKNNIYDDGDQAWTYNGHWSQSPMSRAYQRKLHVSNTVGSYATISISGSNFTLVFAKAQDYGKLDVYVDDVKIETIDQKRSKVAYQMEWMSPGV